MLHVGSGQHLRLFANGITGSQGLETADHAFLNCHRMKGISKFLTMEAVCLLEVAIAVGC
jgi:hypothetical protein